MLSPDIRHDIPDSYNYHDNGNDVLTFCLDLDIFQYKSYSWYTCIPDTLDFSCSFPKFNYYLINYKKEQLIPGQGKLTATNICSYLQWYLVCCATKSFDLT